jgi:hypothetical protein
MSNDEAIAQFKQTGKNLGTFANVDAANNYAQQLHNNQAKQYSDGEPTEPEKRPVGFFEAAGRAFPSGLASMNEVMAKGIGVFPYIEDKTLQAFGINSDIYNRYMKAVHSTGLGQPEVEAEAIKPNEELTTWGKIGWGTSEMLSKLPYIAASGAVGAEEAATAQAFQVVKPLLPRITQGIQSMLPLAAESGVEAVDQSAKQGDKPIVQAAKGMAQATATAVVGAVPLAMRSKIQNTLLRVLEQGAYGYITGIPVAESQKVVGSWINGQPYIPSEFKEMAIQAVPMALMTGVFGAFHAPEYKAKFNEQVGGPEPKLNPSENPAVNQKEEQILASAQAQSPILPEATAPSVETPAAEPSKEQKLDQLFYQLWMHPEGSPEHTAIQQQIDALNKPAEAPATPTAGSKENKESLNAKAKALGYDSVEQFNTQNVLRGDLSPEESQLLKDFSDHNTAARTEKDPAKLAEMDDKDFDAWIKTNTNLSADSTIQREEDLDSHALALEVARKRGDQRLIEKLEEKIKQSGPRRFKSLEEMREFDPNATQEDFDLNQKNSDDFRKKKQEVLEKLGLAEKPAEAPVAEEKPTDVLSNSIVHTVRNNEDIPNIINKGLRAGSNITINPTEPNQSFGGQTVTLVFDKPNVSFEAKGYNPNDGIVTERNPSKPKAALIDSEAINLLTSEPLNPEKINSEITDLYNQLDQERKLSSSNTNIKKNVYGRTAKESELERKIDEKNNQLQEVLDYIDQNPEAKEKPGVSREQAISELTKHIPSDIPVYSYDLSEKETPINLKLEQPTEKPNAVQIENAGEVGVRNAPAVGEGVGTENKPEEVAQQGEAPKEEVAPSNPYDAIQNRYYEGGEDAFKSHEELGNSVADVAKKQKNKTLQEAVVKYREALDLGEDAGEAANKLMEVVSQEADYHEQGGRPKEEKVKPAKRDTMGGYFGATDPIIQFLKENPILSKTEYLKRVKSGQYVEKGGEYDDAPTINRGHATQIYSPKGRLIDQIHAELIEQGLMSPDSTISDLWNKIEKASKNAKNLEEQEKAIAKSQSEREKADKFSKKESQRLEKLKEQDPDKYEAERGGDLKEWFDANRRRGEGGFIELPEGVKEAATKFGEFIYKAGMSFRDWSGEMVKRLGEGVGGFLRRIYHAISTGGGRFTEQGARRGAVDLRGDERFKPKELNEREKTAKTIYDNYVKQFGKPPTQKLIGNILSQKYPGITSEQISDIYNTATGKPKPPTPYAGVVSEPSMQGEMFEQRTTGLKKEVVKQERLSRGLEDIPKQERQSETERVQRAVDRVQADSAVAPSIVARIVDFKEPNISVDDAAALLVERNRLMNDRQNWENILDDEGRSPAERNNAQLQLDSIEEQMDRLDRAQRATGSEWGRLGRMYQRMIAEDYSLESLERRERRNLGRPLEKGEREKLKKEAESIQKTSEELQAAQEKAQTEQEKNAVAETYWKTIQELKAELESRPKVEPQIQRIIERVGSALKSQADKARERVRQRIKEGRFNVGLDPEDIIDHAIIGADYIYEGATDLAKFTTRMVKELGEYVRPYIKEIFAASQQEYDRTTDKEAGVKSDVVKEKALKVQPSIDQIKATGKAEKVANPFLPNLEHLQDPLTHKLVYELARQHILDGVKGEDNVMKAVHNDIKDIYPDATERDVRRAFSEYGKAKYPSKEADRVALAELRTLTRLQESIDRLNEGLKTQRTGLQRNKVTQAIREKTAKLNELLKKVKEPPTEQELASRDAAKQTALRNRIADLDKQLRTGEKLKRTSTEPDSPETENLRLEKNAMEQLLKEIEGEAKPKKTPEEAYNERRQKAIRKRMAEIESRIKNNRYESSPRRIPPTKNTETQRLELELKRKQNDFDRRQLKYQEERKPRWQKLLQGTSELAKGMAITGYHSLYKILGFDIAKMVTTPIEEFTGSVISLLPGMKPKEGALEMGGSLAGRLGKYYSGVPKGAKESLKVYKYGLSESEELFGKVRPNVARWYDFIGGRLHAAMKHIPFTAAEEMYRYNGLSNAEKVAPGSTKNDFVKMAIYKAAYEKAQSAKLQEANTIADGINSYFQRMEQVDPKTGKASLEKVALSTAIKVFLTKAIVKTPANYFKQVYEGGTGLPKGVLKYLKATWNGLDNLTAVEQDAIYKAFKVGGIGFAMGLYGYIDSFKDKKNRVFGGYYQTGRKEGDGDAKWGTVRINGNTFHYIAHNPVTELAQFGSTLGRVQQALMKKTDMPTAIATGFGKSLIAMLGSAPVSGPLMRLGQPYSDPIGQIARGLVPALISNIAQDTKGEVKLAPKNPLQQIESNIPWLQKFVPEKQPSGRRSKATKNPFLESTDSSNPFGKF